MKKFGRVDENHNLIVAALRDVGCFVQSLASIGDGCPDILVSWRGAVVLMEVKRDSKAKLTPEQEHWHAHWKGPKVRIVTTVEEALIAIGAIPSHKNWEHKDGRSGAR